MLRPTTNPSEQRDLPRSCPGKVRLTLARQLYCDMCDTVLGLWGGTVRLQQAQPHGGDSPGCRALIVESRVSVILSGS